MWIADIQDESINSGGGLFGTARMYGGFEGVCLPYQMGKDSSAES